MIEGKNMKKKLKSAHEYSDRVGKMSNLAFLNCVGVRIRPKNQQKKMESDHVLVCLRECVLYVLYFV